MHCSKICAKAAQQLLKGTLRCCIAVCSELKERTENDPSVFFIVTGDESWVYRYDPETKQRLSHWKTPDSLQLKKTQQV
jgi:hypothetical protein